MKQLFKAAAALLMTSVMAVSAQAAKQSVLINATIVDNGRGGLNGVLSPGQSMKVVIVVDPANPDANPSGSAYLSSAGDVIQANFLMLVGGYGHVSSEGSTVWKFKGFLDINNVAPNSGAYIAVDFTLNGAGMTPNQPLPNFTTFTSGSATVDTSALSSTPDLAGTAQPGETVLANVASVSVVPFVSSYGGPYGGFANHIKDVDGDGVIDDLCPDNYDPSQADADGDFYGDACDADNGNNGLPDAFEATYGVSNPAADPDGDSLLNSDEATKGTNPNVADTDADGVADNTDNCPVSTNSGQQDLDADTKGDVCDDDADADGVPKSVEVANSGFMSDTSAADAVADQDSDGANNRDELWQGWLTNPSNSDTDADGVLDGADNCPTVANSGQANMDADASGDVCDADQEGDTMWDAWEIYYGLNSSADDSMGDLDGDTVPNLYEHTLLTLMQPTVADDDGDGIPTSYEVSFYYATGILSLLPNANDAASDYDADGFSNFDEYSAGTDPTNSASFPATGNVKNDFDKDGDSDLFWRDSSSGSNIVWVMQNGLRTASNVLGSNSTAFSVEGIADFDADGDDDVLFRNNSTGQSIIWTLQNGVKVGATVVGTNGTGFSVKGVADFDNDGDADILFRDTAGYSWIWTIQNAAKVSAIYLGANATSYSVEGIADFDADGDSDVLFRNNSTGQSVIWTVQNAAKTGAVVLGTNATTATIKGVADFNGDGDADILFRDGTSGSNLVWTIQNNAKTGAVVLGTNATSYSVAATADFDNDGDSDILFRDTTGANIIWIMQNHAKTGASVLGSNASTYSVAGTADFDGDGDADILYRNNATGANVVWMIQNNAKVAANVLSTNAATMSAKFEK